MADGTETKAAKRSNALTESDKTDILSNVSLRDIVKGKRLGTLEHSPRGHPVTRGAEKRKEEKTEKILPEVSASMKVIEENLKRLQVETAETAETPETEAATEIPLPEKFEMFTHQKLGLKICWGGGGEGGERGAGHCGDDAKRLSCCIKTIDGTFVAEEVVGLER